MIDSETLDEIKRLVDKFAARNSILIKEIRKLQEREAAFRDCLKYYRDDLGTSTQMRAKEVLERFPEEKKV